MRTGYILLLRYDDPAVLELVCYYSIGATYCETILFLQAVGLCSYTSKMWEIKYVGKELRGITREKERQSGKEGGRVGKEGGRI